MRGAPAVRSCLLGGLAAAAVWILRKPRRWLGAGASTNLRASSASPAAPALLECVPLVVEETSDRGKILKSLRACEAGEVLLVEEPAVAVVQASTEPTLQDLQAWIDKLAALPGETRAGVLDLSCPTQAILGGTLADLLGENGEHADVALHCPDSLCTGDMWRFLRIAECNTFQVPDASGGVRIELLILASRMNHSCLPNALRGPGEEEGTVEVRALRRLEAGEEISISYFDDDALCMPTAARRAVLQGRWQFKCECKRCMAPDSLRAFRCAKAGCDGVHLTDIDGEEALGPCARCSAVLSSAAIADAFASEKRFRDALPDAERTASDAVEGLGTALEARDGAALQEAVGAGFAALAACRDVAQSCSQVSPAHHLALRLSKAAVSVRTRLGDGFAAAGQGEQATELWGHTTLELQQALAAEYAALPWPRDARVSELVKLGGLYQRLGMLEDLRRCLKDALGVMKTIYWACDATCRGEAERMQQDVEKALSEARAGLS